MDPLDIHGSIHGSMDVDVPLGSMDVDVTNIHGYPSSDFTGVRSGRNAIQVMRRYSRWKEAAAIGETLFGLLPHICGRYLSLNDQQHVLKQVSGFAADACSLSLRMKDLHQALQRIEFERALIPGYLMDGRSDLSELTLAHPDLAREYDQLRFLGFRTVDTVGDKTAQDNRLWEQRNIPRLIEDCENRIRDKPGFSCFLQPPSVHELMQSAEQGPVIIVNRTDIGSDAIIRSRVDSDLRGELGHLLRIDCCFEKVIKPKIHT
jgi:hypothetical protein